MNKSILIFLLFCLVSPNLFADTRIITVAKSGGDFTDPIAAMNSINDASGGNKYLI